ncbi:MULTISPECIES: helix-turn-helix domain-containing protein [Mycobacterium]|uniref:4Fe-4S Wbl-type domain-containing protein n=2 Tax=Mycobacterium kiyosense TaxID=2871094 RepID=A0A9P3Q660_9MYCO|nr:MULTISPECIES: helix-turn-helix domain-containing protein [Mycobacterium]BDB43319.1 hypothetical protein IWGMT90018_37650 [Mycobacterium kiyosense]BDE13509.1 hypothetical protein MKCMC460_23690 [Mycobacterium sp. 20KCMC460]GLB84153.1 hypothetical protein SRL2020028_34090 [Mycobacterium kiyosense]GLB88442.1 hypothetical protein SRL2020130_12590 [Mycobacterium kiyosense]GLB94633.1 hypothetical protein SRL2020226_14090 [Mycobacterium kiyosense]
MSQNTDPTSTAHTSLPEMLAALAAALPPLPGARCLGQWELFDATSTPWRKRKPPAAVRQARHDALDACAQCPALMACRDWLDNLTPDQQPHGVVAGRIIRPPATPTAADRKTQRAERFAALHQKGLSYRAIATATGSSAGTVRRALNERQPTA